MNQLIASLHNELVFGAIAATVVGAIILQLKQVPDKIFRFVSSKFIFQVVIFEYDIIYDEFENWFFSKYAEKYKDVEATTTQQKSRFPNEHEINEENVYYKQVQGVFLIKYKSKYIVVRKGREKLEGARDSRERYFNQYHFYSIHGAAVTKSLLEECRQFSKNNITKNQIKIYTHSPYGDWHISSRVEAKSINNVVLKKNIKDKLITDLEEFEKNEEWYKSASIFYKRGYCFWGGPGLGKTSLAIAMASYVGRDVYSLDLNSINSNADLRKLFSDLPNKGFLIIEEIDTFFKLREAVANDPKISFSVFLNCIDGIFYKHGLIIVITTNYIDLVDEALKRTGRMDLVIEVPKPTHIEIGEYLRIFYKDIDIKIKEDKDYSYSMSDIQNICMRFKGDPEICIDFIQQHNK